MEKTTSAWKDLVSGLTGVRPVTTLLAGTIVVLIAPTATVMGKQPNLVARDFETNQQLLLGQD
jgi:hypothetical protein